MKVIYYNLGTIRNCQKALYVKDKEILQIQEDEDENQMEDDK